MAGPQGHLLFCLLVFYLTGSSILVVQKVSVSQLQGDMVSRLCWLVVGAGRECTQIGTGLGAPKSGDQCDLP